MYSLFLNICAEFYGGSCCIADLQIAPGQRQVLVESSSSSADAITPHLAEMNV